MMKILSTRTSHLKRPRRPLRHAARATSPAAAGEAFGLRHAASPVRGGGAVNLFQSHFAFRLGSWEVFPYDLLPAQLRPSGLLLGQVSKCRATRGDRGARCSYAFLTTEHRYRPRRPLRHANACHLPRCGRGGFGLRHAASPIRDGGSAEQREAIGALVTHTHFSR